VRLTTSHRKTLLLRNLSRGGQGPTWAVAPLYGWEGYGVESGTGRGGGGFCEEGDEPSVLAPQSLYNGNPAHA
jgi:hypothetical protein